MQRCHAGCGSLQPFRHLVAVASVLQRSPCGTLVTRVWLGVLTFTGSFRFQLVPTPGRPLYALRAGLDRYCAGTAPVCLDHASADAGLFSSVGAMHSLEQLLKALRCAPVADRAGGGFGMTYRYIFLLLHNAHDMFNRIKVRWWPAHRTGTARRPRPARSADVETLQLSGEST